MIVNDSHNKQLQPTVRATLTVIAKVKETLTEKLTVIVNGIS